LYSVDCRTKHLFNIFFAFFLFTKSRIFLNFNFSSYFTRFWGKLWILCPFTSSG
jgi:hypothetical protein